MSQPNLGTLMPCGPRHFRDGELPSIRSSRPHMNKLLAAAVDGVVYDCARAAAQLWR